MIIALLQFRWVEVLIWLRLKVGTFLFRQHI